MASCRGPAARRARRSDAGFSLIELMVVVLIIAVLLAIAIPSFLGARERANERAVQSNLRNASTNTQAFYADHQRYTADTGILEAFDSSLEYTNDLATMSQLRVYVEVTTTLNADDTVYLGVVARTGNCFWIRVVGDQVLPRFAENDCSVRPANPAFVEEW